MPNARIWIALTCCLLALPVLVAAQAQRKPGLWEITTTMTFQQSPMPAGVQASAGSPFASGPHTSQVCLTQAMIDKYGAPMPTSRADCQFTDIVLRATSMTGKMVCSGRMAGTGTVESDWSAGDHAKGKIHFVGTLQMGQNTRPMEWTTDSSSVFKSADCGSVQPLPMPASK